VLVVRGAAAIVGAVHDGTLPVVAFGGSARAARELLLALRAEAARRSADDVLVYVSSAAHRRAARAAGYEMPWTDEAYVFEKQLTKRAARR
jgi:hypothetical protein